MTNIRIDSDDIIDIQEVLNIDLSNDQLEQLTELLDIALNEDDKINEIIMTRKIYYIKKLVRKVIDDIDYHVFDAREDLNDE